MPTVFIYHEVKDKDHWLASPKREELLGPLGVTNIRLFVDPENPTRVGGMMDVPDMEALMAAMRPKRALRRWRTTESCSRRSWCSSRPDGPTNVGGASMRLVPCLSRSWRWRWSATCQEKKQRDHEREEDDHQHPDGSSCPPF